MSLVLELPVSAVAAPSALTGDALLARAAARFDDLRPVAGPVRLGVDLGTASIVLVALDQAGRPVGCASQVCQVAKDGLVVDYIGAIDIVRRLARRLEQGLGTELGPAAIAVPPGTSPADAGAHRHVVEAAGLEVVAVVDEPTAANAVLGLRHGAVVDIGGGTTGLAVIQDGRVVHTADEPTGGWHMSLVLMRRFGLDFDAAEAFKRDPGSRDQAAAVVRPVMEKMALIAQRHLAGWPVDQLWLVGGSSCLPGIDQVFAQVTGRPTRKPSHPLLATPVGIALSCPPPDDGPAGTAAVRASAGWGRP
ncbi:MAG: ethanolamine utilization protein EutJ [Propionibacteriaceae bacterium]|jgi:ethanolamine utilization protein EutJ|nr:ethanolamine utilization protein EutJ [Propionibacteriaceae bacterium]